MDPLKPLIVASLLACFALSTVEGQNCTQQAITDCQQPFSESGGNDTSTFPLWTEEEMNNLCGVYDTYVECLDPFRADCSDAVKTTFEGTEQSFKYVCVDGGKAKYLAGSSCFEDDDVQEEGKECQDEGHTEMRKIETKIGDARSKGQTDKEDRYKKEYCEEIQKSLLDCVYDVLKAKCDEDIAMFEYTKDSNQWTPTMLYLGCEAPPADPSSAAPPPGWNLWLVGLAAILLSFSLQ